MSKFSRLLSIAIIVNWATFFAFASVTRSTAWSNSSASRPTPLDVDADEYAVYSVIIREKHLSRDTKLVVINDATVKGPPVRVGGLTGGNFNPAKEVIDAYERTRKDSEQLSARFDVPVSYLFISQKEHDAFFKNGVREGWDAFYSKYPNCDGMISFSRVGFNNSRDHAIVYFGVSSGGLCGHG
ncbi:MAG TPA: hypothetical protein VEZ90_00605, partial [Blastocatellia bacterium]|nr:hypothetical protein [Blastocatellia bacterium]